MAYPDMDQDPKLIIVPQGGTTRMKLSKITAITAGTIALIFSATAAAAPTTDTNQNSTDQKVEASTNEKPALDLIAWPPYCPPWCLASDTENKGTS